MGRHLEMGRIFLGWLLEWWIAFVAFVATVAVLLYLAQDMAPSQGAFWGAIVALPASTLLVGIDWALSAATIGQRLHRLVIVGLWTYLAAALPITFIGTFLYVSAPTA